jgi:hypothetical protein
MNLSRMFANAIVRRIAYVAVALLFAWLGIGKAYAQSCPVPVYSGATGNVVSEFESQAWAICHERMAALEGKAFTGYRRTGVVCVASGSTVYLRQTPSHTNTGSCPKTSHVEGALWSFIWTTPGCPVGESGVWDPVKKECFDPEACLAHNQEEGFLGVGVIVRPKSDMCVGNCQWKIVAGTGEGCVSIGGVGGGAQACTGEYEFTGASCTVDPPPLVQTPEQAKETKEEECLQAGSGQTMCVKPNGENCYMLAGNVSSICWKPGETGEKSQGPNQQ